VPTKQVLAIDPGKMSGFAFQDDTGFRDAGQLEMMPLLQLAEQDAKAYGAELVIVCESYTITAETAKKSRQTWSLEIIGALRWIAWRYGCEFILQSPADAKRFATDARLHECGMWVKGQDHARDAYRHLLLYLAKTGQIYLQSHE
jgi:hypothetical protein